MYSLPSCQFTHTNRIYRERFTTKTRERKRSSMESSAATVLDEIKAVEEMKAADQIKAVEEIITATAGIKIGEEIKAEEQIQAVEETKDVQEATKDQDNEEIDIVELCIDGEGKTNSDTESTQKKKKNRIQVSNTKKPFVFYLNLAKKYMDQYNDVELSALGMAITTVVTISEILKQSGAIQKKIETSTICVKEDDRGRLIKKAKIQIVLEKPGQELVKPVTAIVGCC